MCTIVRRHLDTRHVRRWFSSQIDRPAAALDRWLKEWDATAAVPEHVEAPTALAWLRRRGPQLPEALVRKLFRQETVRVWDPATAQVRRAARERLLPPGARLLIPKSLLPAAHELAGGRTAAVALTEAQQQAQRAWIQRLRHAVIHDDADLLALNKPAGLAVQGGSGLSVSLDSLMRDAVGQLCSDGGDGLRLVHRLDKETSGVLLLGKTADAAAWLGEAFRSSTQADHGQTTARALRQSRTTKSRRAPWVHKQYWAVVDCSSAKAAHMPAEGMIHLPVAPRSGTTAASVAAAAGQHGSSLPAVSHYRIRTQQGGLAWLQLEPLTGRKHQLRIHCAQGLGAAILGDNKYSPSRGSALQQDVWRELSPALRGHSKLPLFLHCRQIELCKPGQQRSLQLVAALPEAWHHLFDMLGWPLPKENGRQV